jgi:hypothetical protein
MSELRANPAHATTWANAFEGRPVDWAAFFAPYAATVDVPSAHAWEAIAAAFPDAVVVLSTRESAEKWWDSMDQTIYARFRMAWRTPSGAGSGPDTPEPPEQPEMRRMFRAMTKDGFPKYADDRAGAMAYYDAHNAHVRATVPAGRLVEWAVGDGWGPLCAALGRPEPEMEFPRLNSAKTFQETFAKDPLPGG